MTRPPARFWLAALLGLLLHAGVHAETWRFALIGDTPYSERERARLPRMLDSISESGLDFVAHVGDFKSGSERCDDALFEDRYRLFNASATPFIFVPGDNEWSDCHRLSNGSYDPLERLDALRRLFWSRDLSLGARTIKLERQSPAYPEHARFRLGPVLFVTLNIPGSDNNIGMTSRPSAEYKTRNPVVLAWIRDSFALARKEHLRGVVLLFQADPNFAHFSQGFGDRGFRDFLKTLRQEVERFAGQVVAVHGDSHISRIDHPLRSLSGQVLSNFTRVETFGSPITGWTLGEIDSDLPALFRFQPRPWP